MSKTESKSEVQIRFFLGPFEAGHDTTCIKECVRTTDHVSNFKVTNSVLRIFFPRVRTPCGHGAQVIVEGREEQTDGGERNEDPKTNPNQTPKPAGRNSTIL